tara:strand:- start:8 stop:865 length:858 start_codon:yes stop_codon:yes gene_type:complete
MKGVIAAAGRGSRLFPITKTVSKHLLPIYNKPLIYYPITTLINAGITDICIVTNPNEKNLYKKLLGNGSSYGCNFEFCEQKKPKGIPDVLNYAKNVFGKVPITLILGDNIFASSDLLSNSKNTKYENGAKIFATQVEDPSRFGVIQFKDNMEILNIIEKPKFPKSDFAVIGLYVFDAKVYEYLSLIKPSYRNELEIIDILNIYLLRKTLSLKTIKNGSVWFDAGTPESLLKASIYVELFERQSGAMIGCIEEAAFQKKLISKNQMVNLIKTMNTSDYKLYLEKLL